MCTYFFQTHRLMNMTISDRTARKNCVCFNLLLEKREIHFVIYPEEIFLHEVR